jgi:hypothetical protein
MTDQSRPGGGEPGYRGSLPPRTDRLAGPWVLAVIAIFALIFVLSFFNYPSKLFAQPTVQPSPSLPAQSTAPSEAVPSGSSSPSGVPSVSPSVSPSASASAAAS